MSKQFFKEFIDVRETLEKDRLSEEFRVYTADNDACCKAVEKYLYSYKWCRSDKERLLLETADSHTKGENIAQNKGIHYNTYRSMSSRVSKRLYDELGRDFKSIILGNDKKLQDKLIHYCITRVDDFQIMNKYPEIFISEIERDIKSCIVDVGEDFKIVKKDWVILKFFAEYDIETIIKEISLLDKERLAVFYRILTDKRLFKQRADVLSIIKYFKEKISYSSMQAETDLLSREGVLISKKEYQEFLKYKQKKGETE